MSSLICLFFNRSRNESKDHKDRRQTVTRLLFLILWNSKFITLWRSNILHFEQLRTTSRLLQVRRSENLKHNPNINRLLTDRRQKKDWLQNNEKIRTKSTKTTAKSQRLKPTQPKSKGKNAFFYLLTHTKCKQLELTRKSQTGQDPKQNERYDQNSFVLL